jgi:dipeptidyl-peptidase-3
MHEVIGHASGKIADRLNGKPQTALKEQYSALEEARADLVAFYFLPDAKLEELGLVSAADHEELVRAKYEEQTRNALIQLRRVRSGTQLEEDHMRNRQMIIAWLLKNTQAIETRTKDGKSYYVMVDVKAFHDGVGKLLAEVQRIKSEGDYPAARQLFETYGIHFDPKLRDEIVARVDHLNLPSYSGLVMPKLDTTTNAAGEVTDVRISYPRDLTTQMLEYSAATRPLR